VAGAHLEPGRPLRFLEATPCGVTTPSSECPKGRIAPFRLSRVQRDAQAERGGYACCLSRGGHSHGKELPSAADPVSYSAGFVLATGLLHVSGIALGSLTARPIGAITTRSLGGLIAIGGAWFLFRAIGT